MIRGERVVLRPVEEADHRLIQAWQNHPEVWFWMDHEQPFSLDDIAESEARAREEGVPFVIEVDGRSIGRIGLNGFRVIMSMTRESLERNSLHRKGSGS